MYNPIQFICHLGITSALLPAMFTHGNNECCNLFQSKLSADIMIFVVVCYNARAFLAGNFKFRRRKSVEKRNNTSTYSTHEIESQTSENFFFIFFLFYYLFILLHFRGWTSRVYPSVVNHFTRRIPDLTRTGWDSQG